MVTILCILPATQLERAVIYFKKNSVFLVTGINIHRTTIKQSIQTLGYRLQYRRMGALVCFSPQNTDISVIVATDLRAGSPRNGCSVHGRGERLFLLHILSAASKVWRPPSPLPHWNRVALFSGIKRSWREAGPCRADCHKQAWSYTSTPPCVLTHWGRATQICVFTLQLCKTNDANLRF